MAVLPIKIKKINDKAVIPQYATNGSAGMDLVAVSEKVVSDGTKQYIEYGTGLAFEIPKGYVMLVVPRSSISSNTTLMLNNSIGVIDSDYRGEVTFRFKNMTPGFGKKYKIGDRIGQLIVIPYPEIRFDQVEELSETARGEGGYGSSGK